MPRKNKSGPSNPGKNAKSHPSSFPKQQQQYTVIPDPRFSAIHRDPRFMPMNKKKIKVKVDKRFKDEINANADFASSPPVDKFGRPRPNSANETLNRLYDMESESEHSSGSGSHRGSINRNARRGLLQAGLRGEIVSSKEYDDMTSSSESSTFYDQASDSDPESIDFGDDSEVCSELDKEGLFDDVLDRNDIPYGDATPCFAAVNMDWDHIKAADLYKVFDSLKPPRGTVLSVTIYPSQFGRKRMEHESTFGPAIGESRVVTIDADFTENHIKMQEDSDSDHSDFLHPPSKLKKNLQTLETETNDTDFDPVALRKYQLERLRYFYAVIKCDSVDTAMAIFKEADGAEFEATSNFFDLRFIPTSVSFETDEPARDVATPESIAAFRPIQFETRALQSSNIKLTWDQDDPDRTLITRKPVSYNELKTLDYTNYVASDSDDAENDPNSNDISKYRALLGLDDAVHDGRIENRVNGKGTNSESEAGDMEVTFSAGLHESVEKLMIERGERKHLETETTIEKYQRKLYEKKLKKKLAREGNSDQRDTQVNAGSDREDLGFNDPFFSQTIDLERAEALEKQGSAKNPKPKPTEILLTKNGAAIQDANTEGDVSQKKKRMSMRKQRQEEILREEEEDGIAGFEIDATDPRFSSVLNESEYAIDPTNPHFRDTPGMSKLLKEKRHANAKSMLLGAVTPSTRPDSVTEPANTLVELANAVKRKTIIAFSETGTGRRVKSKR